MNQLVVAMFLASAIVFGTQGSAAAAGDLTDQKPVEVQVRLGDKTNAKRFFPAHLELETGKLYKLVLHNASGEKHYFSSEGFARAVFTRKAQVLGPKGDTIAEIKGFIREIEVYPGGTAEWWLVPVKSGEINDLVCTVPGHTEAGMVGRITIR